MRGLATDAEIRSFLQAHWQQEPLLLRQAFPGFTPPFDGDDLAGLACEPNAEARLIRGTPAEGFSVYHGPFSDELFAGLTGDAWTLLVQDVDKFSEDVAQLWQHLSFLPRWRLDDIMLSYSARGGGVGPHEDQYDVFLLQASGTRRWQWARRFDPTLRPGELKVLRQFEAEEEAVLQPGDVLYLPPGVAHNGVTLEPGLTYSFGFRSPSQRDLAIRLADEIVDRSSAQLRLQDPKRPPAGDAAYFSDADRARLRELVRSSMHLDDDALDELAASYLTQPKEHLESTLQPDAMNPLQDATSATGTCCVAARFGSHWLHWVSGEKHCFSIDGEAFRLPSPVAHELSGLAGGSTVEPSRLSPAARTVLEGWWQRGYLSVRR